MTSSLDWRRLQRDLVARGNDTRIPASERRVANLAGRLVEELAKADAAALLRLLAAIGSDADAGDLAHSLVIGAERRNLIIENKHNHKRMVREGPTARLEVSK
jgi:hypothetical protein